VLAVTESVKRADHLRQSCAELPNGHGIFLISTREQLTGDAASSIECSASGLPTSAAQFFSAEAQSTPDADGIAGAFRKCFHENWREIMPRTSDAEEAASSLVI
jgi:hypothetical protein